MKYLYCTTLKPLDYDEWYRFGRYTIQDGQFTASAWSDDLVHWDSTCPISDKPPYDVGHKTLQEFLDDPSTIICKRPSEFRKKYPELLI